MHILTHPSLDVPKLETIKPEHQKSLPKVFQKHILIELPEEIGNKQYDTNFERALADIRIIANILAQLETSIAQLGRYDRTEITRLNELHCIFLEELSIDADSKKPPERSPEDLKAEREYDAMIDRYRGNGWEND